MRLARTSLPLLIVAASTQPACSLLESDFDTSVQLDFEVDDPDRTYSSIDAFNPNDNDDFRENRDRIQDLRIESMEFVFLGIDPENEADLVLGQADVREAGEMDPEVNPWVEGVSAWEGVQVLSNNRFFVDVPGTRQEALTDLLLGVEPGDGNALEVRIDGRADQGPVDFDIRVTVNLAFQAGI